jgi:hypothetical protein
MSINRNGIYPRGSRAGAIVGAAATASILLMLVTLGVVKWTWTRHEVDALYWIIGI